VIIVVCLNPALDVTHHLATVDWGGVNRPRAVRARPGGKGLNVARTLHALGVNVLVLGVAGGITGAGVEAALRERGVPAAFTPVTGETRRTFSVVDDSRVTAFYEPGPAVSEEEFAGFRRGFLDSLIMRVLDVMLAFPALILTIVVATYLGASMLNVIWAISFFSIPAYARLARAVTLKMREQVYIDAARMSGRSDRAILLRHIAPNVLPQLATYSLLQVGIVVMIEATLSFLGAGVGPSQASWGTMIATGQTYLSTNPSLVLVPSQELLRKESSACCNRSKVSNGSE